MAFILMMYELRFLGLIFRVQRPERPINRPPPPTILGPIRRGNGTPQNTPANTALNTPAPNTPATATVLPTPENTPVASPPLTPRSGPLLLHHPQSSKNNGNPIPVPNISLSLNTFTFQYCHYSF